MSRESHCQPFLTTRMKLTMRVVTLIVCFVVVNSGTIGVPDYHKSHSDLSLFGNSAEKSSDYKSYDQQGQTHSSRLDQSSGMSLEVSKGDQQGHDESSWYNSGAEKSSEYKNYDQQGQTHSSWLDQSSGLSSEVSRGDQQGRNESSWYNGDADTFPKNAVQRHKPRSDSPWFNHSEETSSDEKVKALRIETVKLQILSQLGLKEPPPAVTRPSESPNEIIQIMLKEDEEEQQRHRQGRRIDSQERLVIHARNNGVKCSRFDGNYCRIFHFEIDSALNASSASLWMYRTDPSSTKTVSISVSYSNSEEERRNDPFLEEAAKEGWNQVKMPRILLPAAWSGHFYYSIEIRGLNIEDHGDRRPFLMVAKVPTVASRQRRDSCDSNESCCLKPLTVTLVEIGFDWVIYPLQLDINMCTGKCMLDHSRMKTHYERAMSKILENDNSLQESLGVCWTLCCKPKQLEAVRVIYNDTEGTLHDQYITELTVKSCSCS